MIEIRDISHRYAGRDGAGGYWALRGVSLSIETARSFTASERQVLTKIVLPAALPIILAGMRLAIGRALVMVVVAEIYASNRGLGYLIFQAGGMYDTAQVFVGVGILAAAGVTLTALLRALERWLAPWQFDARQSG